MKKFLIVLTVAVAVALSLRSFMPLDYAAADASDPASLCYVEIPSDIPSQMKQYEGFTVSFNRSTHLPNYVVWTLSRQQARGAQERSNNFWQDGEISGCASPADYRNTGYDRGHMAPAADMKWSAAAMNDCFSMANMCPQDHSLNGGAWNKLEEKTRMRAEADSLVVVVCGPVPGEPDAHIGLTGVDVPKAFFKVILSPYTTPPTGIGFLMPNGYVKGGMQAAAVSIDSVERVTGFDFFSALPDDVEAQVESKANFARWSRTR